MLHVITSNPIEVTSLAKYNDNFIIVHLTEKLIAPTADGRKGYHFKIYHQDGMSTDEFDDYETIPGYKYELIPTRSINDAFVAIADDLVEAEDKAESEAAEFDFVPDQIVVACACGKQWNSKAVQYINNEISLDAETRVFDIYRYLKITKESQLEAYVKANLQTEFVYPEDPVAYSYALYQVLGGSPL